MSVTNTTVAKPDISVATQLVELVSKLVVVELQHLLPVVVERVVGVVYLVLGTELVTYQIEFVAADTHFLMMYKDIDVSLVVCVLQGISNFF